MYLFEILIFYLKDTGIIVIPPQKERMSTHISWILSRLHILVLWRVEEGHTSRLHPAAQPMTVTPSCGVILAELAGYSGQIWVESLLEKRCSEAWVFNQIAIPQIVRPNNGQMASVVKRLYRERTDPRAAKAQPNVQLQGGKTVSGQGMWFDAGALA